MTSPACLKSVVVTVGFSQTPPFLLLEMKPLVFISGHTLIAANPASLRPSQGSHALSFGLGLTRVV